MKKNFLRELLREGRPTVGTRLTSRWPVVVEAVGCAGGYDYVEFLAEYAPFTQEELENIAIAAELHGLSAIIKVDYENRGYVAQKAVAAGFDGVLFTDCRSADDVRECIRYVSPDTPEDKGLFGGVSRRFTRFAPAGTPEYASAVRDIVVGIMIEKTGAMDDIEEILSIPRVDFVQWGPTDYAMNTGVRPNKKGEEIRSAELRLLDACRRHNKAFRAECTDIAEAEYYLGLGVKHFHMGSELQILTNYWRSNGSALRNKLEV